MANLLTDIRLTSSASSPATWADMTGMSSTVAVAGTGSVLLLIAQVAQNYASNDPAAHMRFTVGGAHEGPVTNIYSDNTVSANGGFMCYALDGLSAGSHTFALQWQTSGASAAVDTAIERTFQIIEFESDASLLVDITATSSNTVPTSWGNVTDMSSNVTPASGAHHLFLFGAASPSTSDDTYELRFAADGTRFGPHLHNWSDSSNEAGMSGQMAARDDLTATSQTLAVQYQSRQGTGGYSTSFNRCFQVIEFTDNIDLLVDASVTSSFTCPTAWGDVTGLTSTPTIDSTDSIVLAISGGVQASGSGDTAAKVRFLFNNVYDGSEQNFNNDENNGLSSWAMGYAVTGVSGSHPVDVQMVNTGSTPEMDTTRPRTLQVLDFLAGGAPPAAEAHNLTLLGVGS